MGIFQEEWSEKIWDIKYRLRQKDSIQDHTVEDTWRRVATAVAGVELAEAGSRQTNWMSCIGTLTDRA